MGDRRRLLRMLGGVAVAAGLPRLPKVRGARIERVGLQLYTVRHEMEKDVEATIARVAASGYKEVEFAGYFKKTEEHTSELQSQSNLVCRLLLEKKKKI